jgi:hypothetical protein
MKLLIVHSLREKEVNKLTDEEEKKKKDIQSAPSGRICGASFRWIYIG